MRFFLPVLSLLLSAAAIAEPLTAPDVAARTWLLVDHSSGQTLAENEADARIEPASLTKLMTAYLTFGALKQGAIKGDQEIQVSEKAWKAPGSRMFIEPRKPVTIDQLVHGMIVQSGNDACVALAEAIAGTEEAFVQRMNLEARRLGLAATHYTNTTGLPDPQHYTTARDLARLVQALIRDFPDYYPIYSQKEFTYNGITQPNRNRLLWLDPTVDGVKTGHTESAGFCLIASGKRGPRRLISVVLGADSDNLRAQESQRLLNYGFLNFDSVRLYAKDQPISQLRVFKGSDSTVPAGFLDDFVLSLPRGMSDRLKAELVSRQPLLAPVQKGQEIATLKLSLDEGGEMKPYGEYPVVALEAVPVAGIFGRAWDSLMLWFQ
ncbi:MAG: D-alanyl-D-alanine carboxypeptidase [Gammaproteobacteria bacterium]|nr:D-alanyl-D-alanine carboxypeptidase [Gammaproteobacteria bacterium]MBU1416056.1 D-alanyl-D-alanine carboxypeptidase [Gammaproteobacteria bacterium]